MGKKVMVLGLDCYTPGLWCNRFLGTMPNLRKLMAGGVYGALRSSIPPLTIPAWLSMMTGQDAGRLGLYGFRHRKMGSYKDMWIPTATAIDPPTVWKIAGEQGLRSVLIGFPPSFPPKEINGISVGCFLTPDTDANYTYPPEFKEEIKEAIGTYYVDAEINTVDRNLLLGKIYKMTEKRFDLIEHILKTKPWDFFIFVEIGIDRLHHAFWRSIDPQHRWHDSKSPLRDPILKYYSFIDRRLGRVLDLLDDDTVVIAASDHGAKSMKGIFALNQWLIQEGYLKLNSQPEEVMSIERADVDWENTKAWAWGGYCGKIFFNIKGRESQGTVDLKDVADLKKELKEKLELVVDDRGEKMATKVMDPEKIYKVLKGDPPDLMVFLDDLYWRATGNVGHGSLYITEDKEGAEDAVHNWDGIFVLYDPKRPQGKALGTKNIVDIAPTILKIMGLNPIEEMDGQVIEEFF